MVSASGTERLWYSVSRQMSMLDFLCFYYAFMRLQYLLDVQVHLMRDDLLRFGRYCVCVSISHISFSGLLEQMQKRSLCFPSASCSTSVLCRLQMHNFCLGDPIDIVKFQTRLLILFSRSLSDERSKLVVEYSLCF